MNNLQKQFDVNNRNEYFTDFETNFLQIPKVVKPLLNNAKQTFNKIEQMLYSSSAIINSIKASFTNETIQAVLTDNQKS